MFGIKMKQDPDYDFPRLSEEEPDILEELDKDIFSDDYVEKASDANYALGRKLTYALMKEINTHYYNNVYVMHMVVSRLAKHGLITLEQNNELSIIFFTDLPKFRNEGYSILHHMLLEPINNTPEKIELKKYILKRIRARYSNKTKSHPNFDKEDHKKHGEQFRARVAKAFGIQNNSTQPRPQPIPQPRPQPRPQPIPQPRLRSKL